MAERDTEFYLRRIAKCREVPESERTHNVRALLESHELLEAALPTCRCLGAAQRRRRATRCRWRLRATCARLC